MALPTTAGYQIGTGNSSEIRFFPQPAPATATSTATLTVDQLATGVLLGSPGSSAAAYTLPTGTLMDAAFSSMRTDTAFDLFVVNVDGSGSGVITMTAGTGWTTVGLMTVVATAGTAQHFRLRKTGDATWTIYRLA